MQWLEMQERMRLCLYLDPIKQICFCLLQTNITPIGVVMLYGFYNDICIYI